MEKIEYSDINKFLVSIGMILLGTAFFIPIYFLKEDFGLFIRNDQLNNYNESIQLIIITKQHWLVNIYFWLPFLIPILMSASIILISFGLRRWFFRQSKIDEKYDLDIEKLKLEIRSMTPEERKSKTERSIQEITIDKTIDILDVSTSKKLDSNPEVKTMNQIEPELIKYLKVIRDISQQIRKTSFNYYNIFENTNIGNRFEIDLLLKSTEKTKTDKLIDIKFFNTHISLHLLQNSFTQLINLFFYYQKIINKNVSAILLVIYNKETIHEEKIRSFEKEMNIEYGKIIGLNSIQFKFLPEQEIGSFDYSTILKS